MALSGLSLASTGPVVYRFKTSTTATSAKNQAAPLHQQKSPGCVKATSNTAATQQLQLRVQPCRPEGQSELQLLQRGPTSSQDMPYQDTTTSGTAAAKGKPQSSPGLLHQGPNQPVRCTPSDKPPQPAKVSKVAK